ASIVWTRTPADRFSGDGRKGESGPARTMRAYVGTRGSPVRADGTGPFDRRVHGRSFVCGKPRGVSAVAARGAMGGNRAADRLGKGRRPADRVMDRTTVE